MPTTQNDPSATPTVRTSLFRARVGKKTAIAGVAVIATLIGIAVVALSWEKAPEEAAPPPVESAQAPWLVPVPDVIDLKGCELKDLEVTDNGRRLRFPKRCARGYDNPRPR